MSLKQKRFRFREEVLPQDEAAIRCITESIGFFSSMEIRVAVELVEERLNMGKQSGYHFIFLEEATGSYNPVGYCCFGPVSMTQFSFDLYWIVIRRDFRNRGLGKRLLAASEKKILSMGGRRIYVETSSRSDYEPTRTFYEMQGYSREAVLDDFYAPGEAKVIYLKVIT